MLVKLLQTCLSAQTFSAGARRVCVCSADRHIAHAEEMLQKVLSGVFYVPLLQPMRLLLYSSTMSTLVRQVSSAYSQVVRLVAASLGQQPPSYADVIARHCDGVSSLLAD